MRAPLVLLLGLLAAPFWPALAQPSPGAQPGAPRTVHGLAYRDTTDAATTPYMRERCRLDLYVPPDTTGFATVVWFHGGGLRGGDRAIPEALMGEGVAVASASYRLHPRVQNPAYTEDAAAAVAYVLRHIADYGGDAGRVFVAGHSAGGYLAALVGLDRSYLAAHGVEADSLAGLFPLSGHAITHFTPREERGLAWSDVVVDAYAPLAHVRADAPPVVLVTGDRDLELFGRYEEVAYLWRMLTAVDHPDVRLYELGGFDHTGMLAPALQLVLDHVRRLSR